MEKNFDEFAFRGNFQESGPCYSCMRDKVPVFVFNASGKGDNDENEHYCCLCESCLKKALSWFGPSNAPHICSACYWHMSTDGTIKTMGCQNKESAAYGVAVDTDDSCEHWAFDSRI